MGSGVKGRSMMPIIACTARSTALRQGAGRSGFLPGVERSGNCLTVPFPRGYTNPVQWNHPPALPPADLTPIPGRFDTLSTH